MHITQLLLFSAPLGLALAKYCSSGCRTCDYDYKTSTGLNIGTSCWIGGCGMVNLFTIDKLY